MKRILFCGLVLLCLLCALGACRAEDPTAVEMVGADAAIDAAVYEDFASLCSASNVIVRAVYEGSDPFTSATSVFRFRVEKDFIGNCPERVVHVYESSFSSFLPGKTYYLFLSGYRNALYAHIVFNRVQPDFLLGQTKAGYTFWNDRTLDVGSVTDFDRYLKEEIVAKHLYADDSRMQTEPLASAYQNADRVLLVEITAARDVNPNVASCSYQVVEVLKDRPQGGGGLQEAASDETAAVAGTQPLNTPAPAGTQIGARFILLFQFDEATGRYESYPRGMAIFPADSADGAALRNMANE